MKNNMQLCIATVLLWLGCISISAAGDDPVSIKKITGHYQKNVSILKIECDLLIPPPWHINSDSTEQPYLIVTKISLKDSSSGSLVKKEFPDPLQKKLMGEKMEVFEGDLHFNSFFYINPKTAFPLSAVLQYQSCDNKMCYPPRYKELIIDNPDGKIVIKIPEEI